MSNTSKVVNQMTVTEVRAKLPLRVAVTQEILDKANPQSCGDCIGYHTLHAAFPDAMIWSWGRCEGTIMCKDGAVRVSSTNSIMWPVDMMEIKAPRMVTLRYEYTF